ncbi:MAG TPA: lytic transglycosylase domain-containing protein, partial [Chitinophagaceae bacterium]|nr:lytic transglycosylase domain-containing protein [Chitinophagaceae bacterium]
GPWQLMPTTARELGLRVSKKTDERKQYYKSTTAAAKYLRDLYSEYGDWLLVIAAYNAGPGNVNKAIRKAGSRNFWKLQAFLPAETRGHVKRFIGTHYFFEDAGSETTLTKAEAKAHCEALARFANSQAELGGPKTVVMPETETAKDTLTENPDETVMTTNQK